MTDEKRPFRIALLACASTALGCAVLDVTWAAVRSAEPTPGGSFLGALAASVGLWGIAGTVAGLIAGLLAASIASTFPVAGTLRRALDSWRIDAEKDRSAAGGLLALGGAAGVLALVVLVFLRGFALEMQNKRNAALSTAIVAVAALPVAALAWFPIFRALRRIAIVLPRPRALFALGAMALVFVLGVAMAVLSVDWRVINFGPELAAIGFTLLAAAHAWWWYYGPANRLRARLSLGVRRAAAVALAVVLGGSALYTFTRFGGDARATTLVAEETAGARPLLLVGRRLADRDHDGFAGRLGGGDCDDRDPAVHPGATDVPGDGVDQDCSGSDAERVVPRKPVETPRSQAAARLRWDGNLLVITVDTLRADRLDDRHMPRLAALAKQGTVFTHAYAQAPNTPRSFPSFLTSRYPSQVHWTKENANFSPIEPDNLTFFEAIHALGVRTVGEFSHFYLDPKNGIAQGFDEWDNAGALSLHDSNTDVAGPRITPRVVKKLGELAGNKQRFALWTHYFEPHSRYMDHPEFPSHSSGVKGLEEKYDGEVAFTDREIGKVLDALAASGLADRTAVVVFADHGESFGEHRFGGTPMYFHGETLYDEVLRVPLLVRIPGVAPRTVDTPVALLDLGPTLVELMGGQAPAAFQGRSLLGAVLGDPLAPSLVYAELLPCPSWNHSWRALVDGQDGRKLLYKISESSVELYDLRADPSEQHNLAQREPADAAKRKETLLGLMGQLRQEADKR